MCNDFNFEAVRFKREKEIAEKDLAKHQASELAAKNELFQKLENETRRAERDRKLQQTAMMAAELATQSVVLQKQKLLREVPAVSIGPTSDHDVPRQQRRNNFKDEEHAPVLHQQQDFSPQRPTTAPPPFRPPPPQNLVVPNTPSPSKFISPRSVDYENCSPTSQRSNLMGFQQVRDEQVLGDVGAADAGAVRERQLRYRAELALQQRVREEVRARELGGAAGREC